MPLRIPYQPGHIYFITKNVWRRQPVFIDEACAKLLLADFDFYRTKFNYKIYAWVAMPDHYHWIIEPDPQDYLQFHQDQIERKGKYGKDPQRYYLSARMESINSHAAQVINSQRDAVGVTLWQKSFHVRVLFDADALLSAINYIHNNPVKAELCDEASQYPWSSYQAMYNDDHSLLRLDSLPL